MKPTDFTELEIMHRNSPAMQELRTVSTLQSEIKILKILLIGIIAITIIGLVLYTKKAPATRNFEVEEEENW